MADTGLEKSDTDRLLKRIDSLNRHIGQLEYRTQAIEQGNTPWMLTAGVLALAIIIGAVGFANGSIRVNAAGASTTASGDAFNVESMYGLMREKGILADDIDTILIRGGIEQDVVANVRYRVTSTRSKPATTATPAPRASQAPAATQAPSATKAPTDTGGDAYAGDKVKFQMFVMTYCPYGQQAEAGMLEAWDRIGKYTDLDVSFVIYEQYQGGGDDYCIKDGEICSMHGIPELNEGIRQTCIMKYDGIDKWVEYTTKLNAECSLSNVETCWEGIARSVDVDVDKIMTCQLNEGEDLMQADKDMGESLGVRGSPTMFINDAPYSGGRDALSYIRAICGNLSPQPAECQDLPACGQDTDCTQTGKIGKCLNPGQDDAYCEFLDPVEVTVRVLNDKTQAACDSSQMEAAVRNLFPGAKITAVDVASNEGKALVEKYGFVVIPQYIFDEKLEDTDTWSTNVGIRNVFEQKDDIWVLGTDATGANCYISEEARVKAQDEACAKIPKADVPEMKMFIMSYCPFGTKAMQGIQPVVELMGDKIKVAPHYIIYENYGGGGPDYCMAGGKYCSMHGIQELNEGVRQLCLYKYQPELWWDYFSLVSVKCNQNNVDDCWEGQAQAAGIDVARVKTCFEDEALDLLAEEVALNKKYGARGSPTMVLNEQAYDGKRDPESFKQNLCCGFTGDRPAECDTKLASSGAAPSGGSC